VPVVLLLILAIAVPADVSPEQAQSGSFPNLPRLDMDTFLPAVRQQVQQAVAAAESNPKDADASGRLGMILDAYEQYESAAICYQRAHLLDPNSFRWSFYLGWVQALQGQHERAASTLGDALRMTPDYLPAQLKRAGSLLAAGKWVESRDLYQAIGNAHPESAEAHYGLGRVYASLGDARAAVTAYLKSVDVFPPYGAAHYALALAYRQLDEEAASREQFGLYQQNRAAVPPLSDPLRSEVARLNMGSVAHIRRGADLEQAGRIADAIAEHEEALRVDPQAVQAHINLIALYGRLGEFEKAEEHYRAALALDRNQADIHYNYGVLLLRLNRDQDAETSFRQAVQINPYYAAAHNHLGSIYEQQGRLSEALQQFTEAIDNHPNDRLAHFHAGRILANQRKYDEAIQHLLKTLAPDDEQTPRYLYALGATYARAGKLSDAVKYLRAARERAAARGQADLLTSIDKDLGVLEKPVPTVK
jgi:tetratricopeptide (TPR) repeat protein